MKRTEIFHILEPEKSTNHNFDFNTQNETEIIKKKNNE